MPAIVRPGLFLASLLLCVSALSGGIASGVRAPAAAGLQPRAVRRQLPGRP